MTTRPDDRAERLYTRFLMLYPRRFREEYGEALRQLFRDLLDDPTMPRWCVWLGVIADIPGSIVPEHLVRIQGGSAMAMAQWARNASVRRGVYVGLILGLVHLIYNMVNNALNLDGGGYALLNNSLTVALVVCFAGAGFIGARQAGSIRAGTAAGITAAVVSTVIGITTLWLATWLFFARIHQNTAMIADFHRNGAASMDAFIIDDALGATFFGALIALALGTLLGAIGGALAKVSIRLRT